MLISPAERPVSFWAPLGKTSSVPEQLGVDFLTYSPTMGVVGIQRKEINDLVASLSDGRVAREVLQMKESLDVGIWMIEGKPLFTSEGQLLSGHGDFTADSFRGVMFSLQSQGFWLIRTDSAQESMTCLSHLDRWMVKPRHLGLNGVPAAKGMLGAPSDMDWMVHLTQSLPGIGYTRARAVVDACGGLPFRLREDVDLAKVPGVGKVTKQRIERLFARS